MTKLTRRTVTVTGTLAALAAPALIGRRAWAADTVRIGAPYPLSGQAASAGISVKDAIEVGVQIVNEAHPEMKDVPLAATAGLPGLGGRKIELIVADHQGNPATAQSQALRLITQEKVAAIIGAYQSSCVLTASQVAERYGIPFLTGEAASPNLTERGFKWFFRTTPIGTDFGAAYADFLLEAKAHGTRVEKVALVNENTEYGTSVGDAIAKAIEAKGLKISLRIPYSANATDMSSQVLQLKNDSPDVVIFISYTSDAILYIKTMRNLNYKPSIIIGDDSGFSDASFVEAVGDITEGVINRSSYSVGKPGSASFIANELFRKKTGRDLDDTSARGMQGLLTLAEAINRAGSTEPAKIQAALRATDLKANQLIIGYDGVKFDDKGQNIKASTLLVQLRARKWLTVWPSAAAETPLQLPFKGWN